MKWLRVLDTAIFVAGVVAAIYYTASNNEAQGTVVVLTAILYFIARPHIVRS